MQGAIPKRRVPPARSESSTGAGYSDYTTVELSRRLLEILLDPDNMEVQKLNRLKEDLKLQMESECLTWSVRV